MAFQSGKDKMVLMGIYRPPSTSDYVFLKNLNSALKIITEVYNYIIIARDFQINVLEDAKNQNAKYELKNVFKRFKFHSMLTSHH